jgi:hypothetical protein
MYEAFPYKLNKLLPSFVFFFFAELTVLLFQSSFCQPPAMLSVVRLEVES